MSLLALSICAVGIMFNFTCQFIYLRWLRIEMAIISSTIYHSLVNLFVYFIAFTFINAVLISLYVSSSRNGNGQPGRGLLKLFLDITTQLRVIFGCMLTIPLNLFLVSSYWSQSNYIWSILMALSLLPELISAPSSIKKFLRYILLPSRGGMALFHFVSTIDFKTALVYTIGSPILLPLYIVKQTFKLIYTSYAVLLLCSKIGIVKGLSHFSYLWKAGFASIRLSRAIAIIIQNNNHQQYCYSYEYHRFLDVCHQNSANLHIVAHALVQLQKHYDEVLGTAGLKNLLKIWSNHPHSMTGSDQQAIDAVCQQYHQQCSELDHQRPIKKVATLAEYLASSCSLKKYALAHYSFRNHVGIRDLSSLRVNVEAMSTLVSRISHQYDFFLLLNATLSPVLNFFYNNPGHLQWANPIASRYLSDHDVDQAMIGWLEISAVAHIAQAVNMNERLERCDYLYALRQASSLVTHAHPRITLTMHRKAVSRIVRDTHSILFSQGWLTQRWHGLFDVLPPQDGFNQAEQAFLLSTPEKISEEIKALSEQQRRAFFISERDLPRVALC